MTLLSSRFRGDGRREVPLSGSQRTALSQVFFELEHGLLAVEHAPCFCGESDEEVVGEKDRYGLPVRTVICRHCGLLRSDPRFTPDSMRRFYERYYRPLYDTTDDPALVWLRQVRSGTMVWRYVRRFLSRGLVVDVGCAAGGTLHAFLKDGFDCLGVDLDERSLQYGLMMGLPLEKGSIGDLVARDVQVDLVLLRHTLEHLPDLHGTLSDLGKIVRPGGAVYVGVPGIFSIPQNYRTLLLELQNAHVWHFVLDTLRYVFSRYGFELVDGSEEIEALFRRVNTAPIPPDPRCAEQVHRFLQDNEARIDHEEQATQRGRARRLLCRVGVLSTVQDLRAAAAIWAQRWRSGQAHAWVRARVARYIAADLSALDAERFYAHLANCGRCLHDFESQFGLSPSGFRLQGPQTAP